MDNMEYIKSLEERIEKLEKFINAIKFDNSQNVTFTNCNIQAVAFTKSKGITVKNNTVEALAFGSFNAKIESSTIHNLKNQGGKIKNINCTINED